MAESSSSEVTLIALMVTSSIHRTNGGSVESDKEPPFQTFIGSILAAVNPYKIIDGVYSHEIMARYADKQLGEMPPHIYAIANEVYVSMWRMSQNQCVLIR